MIALVVAFALCGAVLLFGSFFRSTKPANLTTRITVGNLAVSASRPREILASLLKRKFREIFGSQKANHRVLFELPDFLELMSVSIASGETIYASLRNVVPRLNGALADELTRTLTALELGADLPGELAELSQRVPQRQLVEFCNKLIMALRRGTPIAKVLTEQAESVRQEVISQLTKQAGKNETRMLVPLVFLILPVTVLFAIYPSLKLLNLTYL